jgi:hypothetical protein
VTRTTLQGAPKGAFHGAYSIAATALVQRKSTCGVATGGPRVGFSREGFKDGATEPGTELTVAHGTVGLVGTIVGAIEVYQVRFIDTATGSSKAALGTMKAIRTSVTMTTFLEAAELVSVDTGHGEEEGSENDGKADHHGSGSFFVKFY